MDADGSGAGEAPWPGYKAFDGGGVGVSAFERAAGPFYYSATEKRARFVVAARRGLHVFRPPAPAASASSGNATWPDQSLH
jgi:hypothetical protein